MSRQAILRLLDTLFRRWWLYVVPVILLAGVGFMQVSNTKEMYRSVGALSVEGPGLITTLDGRVRDQGFGYETPAAATAGSINSLIGLDSFAEAIAEKAGLELSLAPGGITIAKIQSSVGAFGSGRTLVRIGATHEDPAIAQKLATATMETYIDSVIAYEVLDSQVAVNTLEQRLEPQQAAVAEAEQALTDYVTVNNIEIGARNLPPNQAAEISRLTSAIDRANQRVYDTESDLGTAQVALEQAQSDVVQRLRVVDSPRPPLGPQSNIKQTILTFGLYLFLGLLLALAGVVLGTLADHTFRFPGDVRDRLGVRVLTVVPKEGSRRWTKLRGYISNEPTRTVTTTPAPAPAVPTPVPTFETAGSPAAPAPRPAPAPALSTNGEALADGHPQHRQRRRPAGTRPSVTLRKGN